MNFESGYGGLTDKHIKIEEDKLNVKFPISLTNLFLNSNQDGGHPHNISFVVRLPGNNGCFGSCFSGMCCFNPANSRVELISEVTRSLDLERGIIPFGITGFGDYICFDYRADPKTDNPPVVYWAHEFNEGEDVIPLAPNFEEFLDMLMSEEEAEAALAEANKSAK